MSTLNIIETEHNLLYVIKSVCVQIDKLMPITSSFRYFIKSRHMPNTETRLVQPVLQIPMPGAAIATWLFLIGICWLQL
jgi:hypothetical protein